MIRGRTKEYWEYDWKEVEECRNNKKLQKKHKLKPADLEMLLVQPSIAQKKTIAAEGS